MSSTESTNTELIELEATTYGTIIEVLRVVDPKDVFEPVKTRIVEWLDESSFRSTNVPGDPLVQPF